MSDGNPALGAALLALKAELPGVMPSLLADTQRLLGTGKASPRLGALLQDAARLAGESELAEKSGAPAIAAQKAELADMKRIELAAVINEEQLIEFWSKLEAREDMAATLLDLALKAGKAAAIAAIGGL